VLFSAPTVEHFVVLIKDIKPHNKEKIMSLKDTLSIILLICTFLFTIVPLSAQEEQGEIIIISKRVGKEIDQQEREKFKLFQEINGFQSAVYIKLPDGRYFLKITYLDDKTGEIKISRVLQSEASIKNRGDYIDRFEEIQARKEEEEKGGEIITISERVGSEIDQEERDKYKLFQEVKGFQSAVFLKFPGNICILKIIYKDDQTGELKVDRIQQSKESINNIKYNIDHFGEKKALQDTVNQEPGTAFYLELGGKYWGSINVDFPIKKSNRISVGLVLVWPNFMYYYLPGDKKSRVEFGCGFTYNYLADESPIVIHGVFGYRYQKRRGLLFRVGFTPMLLEGKFIPSIGISLGYSL
jgi:hypothetical protein